MKLFSLFFTSVCLLSSLLMADDIVKNDNISTKIFKIDDKQELFNSLKRVFFSSEHKNILDTNWTALHMSKRVTTGFIDIDIEEQSVIISSRNLDENGTKELSLEIYTTKNDEVTNFKSTNFLHKLFWNRLEFILGLENEWIDCYYMSQALGHNNHLLCSPKEQIALKERNLSTKL